MINRDKSPATTDNKENIVVKTMRQIADGITGLTTTDKNGLIISANKLFQRVLLERDISAFGEEWQKYVDRGEIKDYYVETDQFIECMQELLAAYDEATISKQKFEILKAIFIVAGKEKDGDRDSLLPQQYMRIAGSLTSGEIVVLLGEYKRCINLPSRDSRDRTSEGEDWRGLIAFATNLKFSDLVKTHEMGLVEKNLLTDYHPHEPHMAIFGLHERLTEFGYNFCEYIDSYNDDLVSENTE